MTWQPQKYIYLAFHLMEIPSKAVELACEISNRDR